jgi:hypothetical protein
MSHVGYPQRWGLTSAVLLLLLGGTQPVDAESIGINWAGSWNGEYGANSVADHDPASAFGVPAAHWYEPAGEPVETTGSGTFGVLGGEVQFTWAGSTFEGGFAALPQTAYGWVRANQTPFHNDPPTGEAAVLSKFLFATGLGEGANTASHPIVVTVSGLGSIADLAAGYTVSLAASSEWRVNGFTPGAVSDSDGNNASISFDVLPETPGWWIGEPWLSSGAVGTSATGAFTGDSFTLVLDGWNETGSFATGDYIRTALSGVMIEFTPREIPEPSTMLLLMGICSVATLLIRRTF